MNELTQNTERMTSLQIAEITGKEHKNVLQSIRSMEPAWEKVNGLKFQLVEYTDAKGEKRPCYSLSKIESLYIATKFNDEARAKLVLRWEELETEKMSQMKALPQNYKQALMALIAAEEVKEQLMLENEKQKALNVENEKIIDAQDNKIKLLTPKADYTDKVLKSKELLTVTQIAQDFGMSANKLNKILSYIGIQRKVNKQWVLYNQYLGHGYTQSVASDIEMKDGTIKTVNTTYWTRQGQKLIYFMLKREGYNITSEKKFEEDNLWNYANN